MHVNDYDTLKGGIPESLQTIGCSTIVAIIIAYNPSTHSIKNHKIENDI